VRRKRLSANDPLRAAERFANFRSRAVLQDQKVVRWAPLGAQPQTEPLFRTI